MAASKVAKEADLCHRSECDAREVVRREKRTNEVTKADQYLCPNDKSWLLRDLP